MKLTPEIVAKVLRERGLPAEDAHAAVERMRELEAQNKPEQEEGKPKLGDLLVHTREGEYFHLKLEEGRIEMSALPAVLAEGMTATASRKFKPKDIGELLERKGKPAKWLKEKGIRVTPREPLALVELP